MQSPIRKIQDKTSFRAIALTLAFGLAWLEGMVPLGVPGVKFGFSNLVILVCLCMYGFREALMIAFLKIGMSILLFNGFSSFLYTAGGTLASCLSMAAAMHLYKKEVISLVGVSAIGGFCHITAQYIIAAYTLYSTSVFGMYGMAAALTIFTSVILGYLAKKIITQLKNAFYNMKESGPRL